MEENPAPSFNPRELQLLQLAKELEASGKWVQALAPYRKILSSRPHCIPVHIEIGNLLHRHGNYTDAIAEYEAILQIDPQNHDALYNLGNAFSDSGNLAAAIERYCSAVKHHPQSSLAWKELAVSLQQQGNIAEADHAYSRALEINPSYAAAHANRGNLYARQGLIRKAIASYRRALELDPTLHQIHSNLLFFINFDPTFDSETIFAEYRTWNDHYAKNLAPATPPTICSRDAKRKIKIGYVSPDFRDHVIGSYIEPILQHLDREKFEIFLYSDVLNPDETTARLRTYDATWRDCIALTHEQLAETIRNDKIDILVDTSGHMSGNRLLTFARKPAPIQITQLGYPNTTGLDTIDYRITDTHMDPVGMTERFHTEKLYRLPHCAFCYTPLANSPAVAPSPFLQSKVITFGSMNNFAKVSDATVELWSRILRDIPPSRLLILIQGGNANAHIVHQRFAPFGIEPDRLLLEGLRPRRDYLELHNHIDINLDPFPYNGGITTFESLWMGVPVITLAGNNQVSRHGVSIYQNLGLTDWIARDLDDYHRIALQLSHDPNHLLEARPFLRTMMANSLLMDGPAYSRDLAESYLSIWKETLA